MVCSPPVYDRVSQTGNGAHCSPLKDSLRAAFRAGKHLHVAATGVRKARSEFFNGLIGADAICRGPLRYNVPR